MIYQALIVDDEEIVCRGLSQFIKWQEHGFEVSGTANSADDALSIIEKMHIDVVITDIRMPQKTGLDLIKILQRRFGLSYKARKPAGNGTASGPAPGGI